MNENLFFKDEDLENELRHASLAVIIIFDQNLRDLTIFSKGGLDKKTVVNVLQLSVENLERAIETDNISNN